MTLKVATLVAVAVALALPAHAGAARLHFEQGEGLAAPGFFDFTARGGERNHVAVAIRTSEVVLIDRGVDAIRLTPDARERGCTKTLPNRVACPRFAIFVNLGDRADTIAFSPGAFGSDHPHKHPLSLREDPSDYEDEAIPEATVVDAGAGDDVVTGSRFRDTIYPGIGHDRVEARGGPDIVYVGPDSKKDSLAGNGGIDAVNFNGWGRRHKLTKVPVTIDLKAGTIGGGGDHDTIDGFERAHGGPENDKLRGSAEGDALYGEGGKDLVDGRAGNDLLVGNDAILAATNTYFGRAGNDVLDARSRGEGNDDRPTSSLNCGPGTDTQVGDRDDLLDSCERSVFRIPFIEDLGDEPSPFYGVRVRTAPVSQDADSATFEVACPGSSAYAHTGCDGTVTLTSPPGSGDAEPYGSGEWSLEPDTRGEVEVPLNAAGQAAIAAGAPIAVEVRALLRRDATEVFRRALFGWQLVLGP
jgi:Ca2+-binding RTX toxin-like protein